MTNAIQKLNDNFRKTFTGGRVMLTLGINTNPVMKLLKSLGKLSNSTILRQIMIHTMSMIWVVLSIKDRESSGKLIIMIGI